MGKTRTIPLMVFVVVATATLAYAQATQPIPNPIHRTGASTDATATTPAVNLGALDAGRVLLALGAVLGLILLLRFLIRRMAPGAMGRSTKGIRVISRTYLGPKQQVMVLQVGRRLLIVGNTSQHLSTLCEINDPDEAAVLLAQMQGTSAGASRESFAEALSRKTEEFSKPVRNIDATDPALDATRTELNGLAERVRVLTQHLKRA